MVDMLTGVEEGRVEGSGEGCGGTMVRRLFLH